MLRQKLAIGRDRAVRETATWLPATVLLLFSGLIIALFLLLLAGSLYDKRRVALAEAERTTQNLVRTLEEQAVSSVRELDIVADGLATLFEARRERGPLDAGEAARTLAARMHGDQPYSNLLLIDAGGQVVAQGRDGPMERDHSHRDYFEALRDDPQRPFILSKPFFASPGGDWTFGLARRLHAPDGSFAGIILATIDVGIFDRFYASLDTGPAGTLNLFDQYATTWIARFPKPPAGNSHDIANSALEPYLRRGQRSGTTTLVSAIDGVERIVSFRRAGELPLLVIAGLGKDDILAGWRRELRSYCIGGAIATAVVVALTLLLLRQLRKLRNSEKLAALSNRRFVDAIENLPSGFLLFDAEDRLILANRRAIEIDPKLFTADVRFIDFVRDAASRTVAPEQMPEGEEAWIEWRLAHHRSPRGPIEVLNRDGAWIRVDEARTSEGGSVVVRSDITQIKRAEAKMRESEQRFRDFAETASDWYWETDAAHRFTYVSERLAVLGVEVQRLVGGRLEDWAEDFEPASPKWRRHLYQREHHLSFLDFVFAFRGAVGVERFASVSAKPLFDAVGRFTGYRGSGRDVTEAIRTEARLREAKTVAETASRAKSEFLAGISHELRTPLNAIIGFSELLLRGVPRAPENPKTREYLGDIHSSGQHLLRLINDILEMSRIEAGKAELHEEEVDLDAVIETCFMLIRQRAEHGGITLRRPSAAPLPKILADETRLKQIVLNLLSNAVKFSPPGSKVEVEIGVASDGTLAITVRDEGIGMTEGEIQVAMQPFRQVDSSLARRYEGSGLGLPLTHGLVELHGGKLIIESAPGVGTTARVILPAARVGARAKEHKTARR
jgi:PAS domain S-box-containing protein